MDPSGGREAKISDASSPPHNLQGGGVASSHSSSLLDQSVEFINDHLRAFRAIPWLVGGVGAVLFVRYSGMFTRFRCISDIPQQLLRENRRLSGVVAGIHWDSIDVWHTPLGARLLRWRLAPPNPCPEEQVLRVGFAGVAVGCPEGVEQWLASQLLGRRVWCTLLERHQRTVQCVVHTRRRSFLRKVSVNEVLVSRGLGAVEEEVRGFRSSEDCTKFLEALRKKEGKARGRGEGLWEGHKDEVFWRKVVRYWRRTFSGNRPVASRPD